MNIEVSTKTVYKVGNIEFSSMELAENYIENHIGTAQDEAYLKFLGEKLGTTKQPWERKACCRVLRRYFVEVAAIFGYKAEKL